MKKRVFIAFCALLILAGVLGGIKFLQINRMIAQGKQNVPPPSTVTTTTVESASWETRLPSVGSLEAVSVVA